MEYETKKWIIRWTSYFDHKHGRDNAPARRIRNYNWQFTNQFEALRNYRHLVEKNVLSAHLIRIDIKNNEYVLHSIDKAVPVTYSEV